MRYAIREQNNSWGAESVLKLRKFWKDGLSSGEIADVMNLTRNQVLGKLWRLGLCNRNKKNG